MKKNILLIISLVFMLGCAGGSMNTSLTGAQDEKPLIQEGMIQSQVVTNLQTTPSRTYFENNGCLVEIYKIKDNSEIKKKLSNSAMNTFLSNAGSAITSIPGSNILTSMAREKANKDSYTSYMVKYTEDEKVKSFAELKK